MPVSDITYCDECRVPEQFTNNHIWMNSGVTVVTTNQAQRQILVESENLDPLFRVSPRS